MRSAGLDDHELTSLRSAEHARPVRAWIAIALLGWGSAAFAQSDPRADTVITIDGESVTGVLTERVVDDHATLALESGEARRFEWADIVYAGPTIYAPRIPEPAPPPPPPPDPHLRFDLRSAGDPILFFSIRGAEMPEPLCVTPCSTLLLPGVHQLALSTERGRPARASPITLDRPGVLVGRYEDRGTLRDTGWTILGAGSGAGVILSIAPAAIADTSVQALLLVSGAITLTLAIVVGILLGELGDVSEILLEGSPAP